jgi:hypothetical protein
VGVAAVAVDLLGAYGDRIEVLAAHGALAFAALDGALQTAIGAVGAQAADLRRGLGAGLGLAERLAAAVGQVAQ